MNFFVSRTMVSSVSCFLLYGWPMVFICFNCSSVLELDFMLTCPILGEVRYMQSILPCVSKVANIDEFKYFFGERITFRIYIAA